MNNFNLLTWLITHIQIFLYHWYTFNVNSNKVLVTGAAGFIGFHVCKNLLEVGYDVIGVDNLNSYYDVNLKYARLKKLEECISSNKSSWHFYKSDISKKESLLEIFNKSSSE